MTAPQDAETYIQIEVIILVIINFACKLRIRFATLFEKHLFNVPLLTNNPDPDVVFFRRD